MTIYADNSYTIGNTPLVRLKNFGQNGNLLVKLNLVIQASA
ncbi:cysteine synthase [Actinobacillus equuli]|nr:cysteine synthase [Actinobacillus equuli]